jgi:hypothetical protein
MSFGSETYKEAMRLIASPQVEGAQIEYEKYVEKNPALLRRYAIECMARAVGEMCEGHDDCLAAVAEVMNAWGEKAGR